MTRQVKAKCSFCGKAREQVQRLVAGPGVYICDQCVALCTQIINEPSPPTAVGAAPRSGRRWLVRLVRRRDQLRPGGPGLATDR